MSLQRTFLRTKRKRDRRDAEQLLAKLPKPPIEDGVCACGCSHRPTKGACPKFLVTKSGSKAKCCICDHSPACHRRKNEPVPTDWDTPEKWNPAWPIKYLPGGHPVREAILNALKKNGHRENQVNPTQDGKENREPEWPHGKP